MDAPRVLPDRPSLRYLKFEAKRRVSAGEAAALHQAQLAIAREHGLPSWTALKRLVSEQQAECHPLAHLRGVVSRFADAERSGWVAPSEAELREHFGDELFESARLYARAGFQPTGEREPLRSGPSRTVVYMARELGARS